MKISFQALVRLLIDNDQRFTILRAKQWPESNIIKFCASPTSPITSFVISNPQDHIEVSNERSSQPAMDGKILLFYSLDSGCVVACCNEWNQLIRSEINKAKNKSRLSIAIVLASSINNALQL